MLYSSFQTRPGVPRCLLSGDNQDTAGRNAFQISNGAVYAEKDCNKPQISSSDESRLSGDRISFSSRPEPQEKPDIGFNVKDFPDYDDQGTKVKEKDMRNRDVINTGDPGNCRADGLLTSYEKVIDFTYDAGVKTQIDTDLDIGIVTECLDTCSGSGNECLSMTLLNERGGRQRCFSHSGSAFVDGNSPTAATGVTYFEKICIRGDQGIFLQKKEIINDCIVLCLDRTCRKGWSFTRLPRFEFIGDANEEVNNVRSIAECRNLCLAATFYTCRSATYDSNARICRLSEETRRSAPSDFRPADTGTDYLENECASGKFIFVAIASLI